MDWLQSNFELFIIVKYDGVDWVIYDSHNSLLPSGAVIKSIATDSTKLWVGTHGGLVSFDGTIWELYSGLPSIIINSVFVDNNNNKWVSFFTELESIMIQHGQYIVGVTLRLHYIITQ